MTLALSLYLDALRFAPFTVPACEPGQVLIDVQAAGMNFRDVLKALALYPGEAPDARIYGDEVGGFITAVGADHCELRMTTDALAWPAMALGMTGAEFEVREPPELVALLHEWADRFTRAAQARSA